MNERTHIQNTKPKSINDIITQVQRLLVSEITSLTNKTKNIHISESTRK